MCGLGVFVRCTKLMGTYFLVLTSVHELHVLYWLNFNQIWQEYSIGHTPLLKSRLLTLTLYFVLFNVTKVKTHIYFLVLIIPHKLQSFLGACSFVERELVDHEHPRPFQGHWGQNPYFRMIMIPPVEFQCNFAGTFLMAYPLPKGWWVTLTYFSRSQRSKALFSDSCDCTKTTTQILMQIGMGHSFWYAPLAN